MTEVPELQKNTMHLADLSVTHRTGSWWRSVSWAHCTECGGVLAGVTDSTEGLYDGDELACPECGQVHQMSADEHGCGIEDMPGGLRPSSVALLRRLIGMPRDEWWSAEAEEPKP